MPSRWTFSIPPIAAFIERRLVRERTTRREPLTIIDPFCGESTIATTRNDWGRGGKPAAEWLAELIAQGAQADVVLFDPPYSPRQIAECYKGLGLKAAMADTQNAALYASVKPLLAALTKPMGLALSFGWTTSGLGKDFGPIEELLLVQHGGAHNDTICTAQRKTSTHMTPQDDRGVSENSLSMGEHR